AAHDVLIKNGIDEEAGETTIPELKVFTSNYSEYSEEQITPSTVNMYLRTTTRNSSSTRYSVLFKDSSENTKWSDATFEKSQQSGRTTYYYYKLNKPSNASSLRIYKFNASSENSTSDYLATSRDWSSVNTNYDTLAFSESNNQITNGNWSSFTSSGGQFGPGGMQEGNKDKSEHSAKGIKSDNEIMVNSGFINIKAYDDGMHANYGTALENGTTGTGDLTINGGSIEIYASDDGLHADRNMNINGGEINITNAYEGIEGNLININGGYTKISASDDGINGANKANISPLITVTGGVLDITVKGNDVDGIDSNGSYQQSGGLVISRGYGTNRMSTGLDVDGTATLSGGTMVLFGQPEKSPTLSNGAVSKTISGTYDAGTWIFTCGTTTFETTNLYSHSGVYIFSELGTDWKVVKK
ncbi:MAG: carbohydrate-binding domain-containing protein, partial [Bacilli bacterium]|nr:carbohydrate-binding domain-containing protein [Bacilli bacterium]